MYEEASEVLLAIHDRNELDLIDALGDLLYVTAGTVVAVHGEFKGQIHLPRLGSPAVWSRGYLHAITDMVGLVVNATTTRDFHPALYYCCQYPLEAGYPIRDIFDEIHRSNMSKQVTKDSRVRDKGPDYSPPDLRRFLRAA